MKLNKKILSTLEQYYSSLDHFRDPDQDSFLDVPNVLSNKEYRTYLIFPLMEDDIEPVIKTKKGKTVLREPPSSNPDENELVNIKMYDDKGKRVKNWDSKLKDLDRTEKEEVVNVIDEDFENDQDEDDNEMGELSQSNFGEENPGQDPNQTQGMQNLGSNMDGMMGMSGMASVEKKTSEEIGRIFELKKIYSRLLSIESQLSFSSDIILQKLRKFISDAVELFETLVHNIDSFKKEIDDIIILYYQFLDEVYIIIKNYYKKKKSEEKRETKIESKPEQIKKTPIFLP